VIVVKDFAGVAFHTATSEQRGDVWVRLSGNADMAADAGLDVYLKTLHAEMMRLGRKRVNVDLRELYFMNSTCLKHLVTWITSIQEAPKMARYTISIQSNSVLRWQRRSLDALKNLGGDTIEIVG